MTAAIGEYAEYALNMGIRGALNNVDTFPVPTHVIVAHRDGTIVGARVFFLSTKSVWVAPAAKEGEGVTVEYGATEYQRKSQTPLDIELASFNVHANQDDNGFWINKNTYVQL